MRHLLLTVAALALPFAAAAQQLPSFKYPEPPASSYRALTNVPFRTGDTDPLNMDVYRPSKAGRAPTVIFFNQASGAERSNSFYVAWHGSRPRRGSRRSCRICVRRPWCRIS